MDKFVSLVSEVLGQPAVRLAGRQYTFGPFYVVFAVNFGRNPYIDANIWFDGQLLLVIRARSNDQHWVYTLKECKGGSFNFTPIYRSMTSIVDIHDWNIQEEKASNNYYESYEISRTVDRNIRIEDKLLKIDYRHKDGSLIGNFVYDFNE